MMGEEETSPDCPSDLIAPAPVSQAIRPPDVVSNPDSTERRLRGHLTTFFAESADPIRPESRFPLWRDRKTLPGMTELRETANETVSSVFRFWEATHHDDQDHRPWTEVDRWRS